MKGLLIGLLLGLAFAAGAAYAVSTNIPYISGTLTAGDCLLAGSDALSVVDSASVCGVKTRVASGSTDTLAATDCGREVEYTNAGAVTVTIPASIVPAVGTRCGIVVRTTTANKTSVNGTAVTAATLVSADSYTGTQAVAGSAILLTLTTVGSTATAYLDGHGS